MGVDGIELRSWTITQCGMGIEIKGIADVLKYIDDFEAKQRTVTVNRLHRAGLKFVTYARTKTRTSAKSMSKNVTIDSPGFFDWTGVLRSSIGYVITYDGVVIDSDFKTTSGTKPSDVNGVQEGKEFATKLASEFTEGYALVCVAGANYASYVEAKGYDVITGGGFVADEEIKRLFKL